MAVAGTTPAAVDASIVQMVSPRVDALVPGPRLVVKTRVQKGARIIRARLNGRDVARALTRRPLTTADGLVRGGNRLKIHSRSASGKVDYDEVSFISTVPQRGLVKMGTPSTTAAPVKLAARATSALVRFEATLNGKNVSAAFTAPEGTGLRTAMLGAAEGLRHGQNRLRFTAVTFSGGYSSVVSTFRVRPDRPLAHAGTDRRAKAGMNLRLDGRKSVPAPGGSGPLRYTWTLTRKPAGSTARLADAASTRPSLTPDVAGTYVARLVVRHTGDSAKTGAGQNAVVASAPDTIKILTVPPEPQIPIDTMASEGGVPGIRINSTFFANPTRQAQVLVLDRSTLEPAFTTAVSDVGDLTQSLAGPSSAKLVVVTSPAGAALAADATTAQRGLAQFTSALDGIGANAGASAVDMLTGARPFSVIGVPGAQGGAHQSAQPATATLSAGAMRGFLMQDAASEYAFTFGDFPVYNTRASGSATSNTITVGAASYPVTLTIPQPPGCIDAAASGGYQVLVLDRTDLSPVLNQAFLTSDACSKSPDTGAMTQALTAAAADRLVFVVSIGSPTFPNNPIPVPNTLAAAIQGVGGTADLIFRLGPTDTYSLVGTVGAGRQEASSLIPNQTKAGALQGVIGRTRDGRFEPKLGSTISTNFGLANIMFQPPSGWPADGTPFLAAANAYVAEQLDLPTSTARLSYTDPSIDWTAKAAALNALTWPAGTTFSALQFQQVQQQLLFEFPLVAAARAYLTSVSGALTPGTTTFDFPSIASSAEALVGTSSTAGLSANYSDLLDGGLNAAMPLSSPSASAMSVAATAATVTGDFANRPDGSPAGVVVSAGLGFGAGLGAAATTSQAALAALEQSVLTDYGRLLAVGQKVTSDPSWSWSKLHTKSVILGMGSGGVQAAYAANLYSTYPAYVFQPTSGTMTSLNALFCSEGIVFGGGNTSPLKALPVWDQWAEVVDNTGLRRLWATILPVKKSGLTSISYPPAAATIPLFLPSLSAGGGAFAPWFFRRTYGDPVGGTRAIAVTLPATTGPFASCS
jgi:hypothetical protein